MLRRRNGAEQERQEDEQALYHELHPVDASLPLSVDAAIPTIFSGGRTRLQ
jgi:hypothetical protein